MRPLPIVFISYSMGGGAGRVLTQIAKGLTAHGAEVEVACMRLDESLGRELEHDGVAVCMLPDKGLRRSLRVVREFLRDRRDWTVISSGYGTNFIVMAARGLAGHRGKVVLREDLHLTATWNAERGPLDRRLLQWLVGAAYRWADAVVAVSKGAREDLEQMIGPRGPRPRTIYNPVVDENLREKAAQEVDHEWLRDDAQVPVILGAGRLVEQKDFGTLVKAFGWVRESIAARLIIVGDGPRGPQVEAAVQAGGLQDDVALVGWDSNPIRWMARASVFVLSSRWEGFGLVLVEAMAVGTPVVSTRCESGPAEILEEGKWGALVAPGDDADLARAILWTLKEPPEEADLQERSEAFSVDEAVKQYITMLEELNEVMTT